MNLELHTTWRSPQTHPFEVVERKGWGHPDTLADALAEHLSQTYCRYTLARFGAVLRHQFDKTVIMCGRARVSFGDGALLDPIRVLLNGRASARLGDEIIPLEPLLLDAARAFFKARFPMLDPDRDFRFIFEVRHGENSTTGGIHGGPADDGAAIHYRFNPRTLADLPETHLIEANDTSLGCGWSHYSDVERVVLEVERSLNIKGPEREFPWLGSDIKIMATRRGQKLSLVAAVPILCTETASKDEYFDRLSLVEKRILSIVERVAGHLIVEELVLNSGDNVNSRKLYMNFTGSSIESGDEGVVGRGNRIGGLIAPLRPMTMEGIAGKNPRYHVGKVYCAAAWDIAHRLHTLGCPGASVYLINRMGEPLATPWRAIIETSPDTITLSAVAAIVDQAMHDPGTITQRILDNEFPLF